ncbi:MAG: hypothetical protein A4E25_02419 [Methanobacterium sp. PtaB.Bin024]|nr:MAG: hypothetical protein A4E25_02419 [Methanobacterium sp. PtaB.Bin024]
MRHSYGSVDRRKILTYQPQLLQRSEDLLIFLGRDFHKWLNEILEFLDGIYQVNAKNLGKDSVNSGDLDQLVGLLINIDNELMDVFKSRQKLDFNHYYVSIMDEKYKKRQSNWYGRYMHKIDRRVLEITPEIRYMHMMEIVNYAHKLWKTKEGRNLRLEVMKKMK